MTQNPVYVPEVETLPTLPALHEGKGKRPLTEEDLFIVSEITTLKQDLDCLHNRFDQAIDPVLIDSIIFEIQAVQMKYMYYLGLCKEKGIVYGVFTR